MAKLSYKVSYYVFYVCIALILVVLGMFYGVGYSETNAAGLVEPANTPALMYLMYGMFAVTVVATLIGAIAQFGGALKDNPKGAIKSLIGLILLIVLLIVTYNIGSSETVIIQCLNSYSFYYPICISFSQDGYRYTSNRSGRLRLAASWRERNSGIQTLRPCIFHCCNSDPEHR